MRICLYTETALPKIGGQEMVVDALARQFQDLGHEVTVLAPYPRLPLRARDDGLPYPVFRHPRFYSTKLFVSWYRWWLLRHFCKRPFDLLHCHGLYPSGYLAGLCKPRLGVPIVLTSHGGDVHKTNVRLARPVLLRRHVEALRNADRLIAISRFTEEGYQRLCPGHPGIVHIPNGVDVEKFQTPAPLPAPWNARFRPREYFLFVGRLKHRKAVDVLLDALTRVDPAKTMPLVVAGGGEEADALARQCQESNLADRVFFLGHVEHPAKASWLGNAFCTIVPSRTWESFGLVVLESYASGTPVIVSALPGLQDLVRERETGLVVPAESAEALSRAMNFLMENAGLAQRMGDRARELSAGFGWGVIARRHLELYESLLGLRFAHAETFPRTMACGER